MIRIGKLANFYGGIWVKKGEGEKIGCCFMGLDDYNGIMWEEISLTLYSQLLKHNQTQNPKPLHKTSKDTYLQALKIVEDYHKQLQASIKKVGALDDEWDLCNLIKGDYVVNYCSTSKYLTIGKKYELTDIGDSIGDSGWRGCIKDDRGKKKWIRDRGLFKKP